MNTNTNAVTRFNFDVYHECEFEAHDGYWVKFTDHERVVGELYNQLSTIKRHAQERATEDGSEITALRTALAASRAEVEGLRAACSGSAYTLFLDAYHKACETSKPSDWHDAAMLAKQWEQRIDAAMENGNV